jgi:hypothetical protein
MNIKKGLLALAVGAVLYVSSALFSAAVGSFYPLGIAPEWSTFVLAPLLLASFVCVAVFVWGALASLSRWARS